MAAPAQVEIWIGLDVGKKFHHAVVLNDASGVPSTGAWRTARPIWSRSSTPLLGTASSGR